MKRNALLCMLALVFASCGGFGNKEKNGKRDMRIVCISKQLTEMVFALGNPVNNKPLVVFADE